MNAYFKLCSSKNDYDKNESTNDSDNADIDKLSNENLEALFSPICKNEYGHENWCFAKGNFWELKFESMPFCGKVDEPR